MKINSGANFSSIDNREKKQKSQDRSIIQIPATAPELINSYDRAYQSQLNLPTLVDLLRYRAEHQPQQKAFVFLKNGENESASLTYQELDSQARAIAARLQQLDATNERALLLYQPNLEFIAAFFGCLYARVLAVPAYPPRRNRSIERIQAIRDNAQAKFALTDTLVLKNLENSSTQNELASLNWLATDAIDLNLAQTWQKPEIGSDTLAFLQYTSGSTGTPKGVMVTHGNILSNEEMICQGFQHQDETVVVGWLPMFHDMGLIGNVLQPLYLGRPGILMSPVDFLQKPIRWLQAISHYQATTSGGPQFCLRYCLSQNYSRAD